MFLQCFVPELLYVLLGFVVFGYFDEYVVLRTAHFKVFVVFFAEGDGFINKVNVIVLWV